MAYDYLRQQSWGEGVEEKAAVEKHKDLFLDEADTRAMEVCEALIQELPAKISEEDNEIVTKVVGRHLMSSFIKVCREVEEGCEKKQAKQLEDLTAQYEAREQNYERMAEEFQKEKEAAVKDAENIRNSLSNKIEKLEKQVKEANDGLKETEAKWKKREDDTEASYSQSLLAERTEREETEEALQQVKAEQTKAVKQYEEALFNYDRQVKETEEYKADKEKAEEIVQEIVAAQEEARQKCVDLEKALQDAEAKISNLEAAAEKPARRFAKKEAELQDEIEDYKHTNDNLKSNHNDQLESLHNELKAREQDVEKGRKKIKELREETTSLTKKLSECRARHRAPDNQPNVSDGDIQGPRDGSNAQGEQRDLERDNQQLRTKLQLAQNQLDTYIEEGGPKSDEAKEKPEDIRKESNKRTMQKAMQALNGDPESSYKKDKEVAKRQLGLALEELDAIEEQLREIQTKDEAHQQEIDDLNQALEKAQREIATLGVDSEKLRELRQVTQQLMDYHDAVEVALTQYLGQFDANGEDVAQAVQDVSLDAFQDYMGSLFERCQEQLNSCRAERDAGQDDGALSARIAGLEAELQRLQVGVSLIACNTTMREALLLNRRKNGLANNPELDLVAPVPAPQPGNPGQPVHLRGQAIERPPGGPDLIRTSFGGQAGWMATAHLLGLFILFVTIIAEGRKYGLWRVANAETRGVYAHNRAYMCMSLPHMSFFSELIVRVLKG